MRCALLAGCIICLALVVGEAEAQHRAAEEIELRISAGRLTLKAENVGIGEVLRQVARALNARLWVSGELNAQARHWELREVPVEEAVVQIARPWNVLVVLDRDTPGSDAALVREIYVLGRPGADSTSTVQARPAPTDHLVEITRTLTQDADPEIRRAAAAELGSIGTDESVRALERALGDADGRVLVEVVESLGRIGTDEAIRLVGQTALGSRDPEVFAAAVRVLESSSSEQASMMLLAIKAREQTASPAARSSSETGEQRPQLR